MSPELRIVARSHPFRRGGQLLFRHRVRTQLSRRVAGGRVVSLLMGAVLLLAACGGGGDEASEEPSRESSRTGQDRIDTFDPVPADVAFDVEGSISEGLGSLSSLSAEEELRLLEAAPLVVDFVALAPRVQKQAYRVGYQAGGEYFSELPADLSVTVAHDETRHKVSGVSGSAVAYQYYTLEDGEFTCVRLGVWECEASTEETELSDFGAETLLYAMFVVAQNPASYELATREDTVVGVPVRCLSAVQVRPIDDPELEGDVEVCVTGEGVPLRARTPVMDLEGVWYEPGVSDADFALPA